MTNLMVKCLEQKMKLDKVMMVKCWVLHMDQQIEVNLGGIHWERHWARHWGHKLELREVPIIGSQEVMTM